METIEQLQAQGGESHSETGKRNPIRKDTNNILTALVMAKNPRLIVEVGTAYGVSALCMAQGLPKDGHIDSYEFDAEVSGKANETFRTHGVPVRSVAGMFPESFEVPPMAVDMVFLDGEKSGYLRDFKALEPYLAPDALIVADNTIDRQSECQDFLDYLQSNYKVVTIPTECGLTVARGG